MNPFIKSSLLFAFILIFSPVFSETKIKKQPTNDQQQFVMNVSPADAGFDASRLSRIDSMMTHMVKQGVVPNIATFVAKNGQVVHRKNYGFQNIADSTELTSDHIFRIASQTKAITSVALMTLYEEGRFLLDDPLSMYIPEFKDMQVLEQFNEADTTYTTRPAKRQITIRHLLTHTSGIHYGILGGGKGGMMFAKEHIPAVNSLDDVTIEQVVKKIARMPLMFDPGDNYMYGMNTDVVGYLIEVLSGQKLNQFITERVLRPLGMNNTWFYLPANKTDLLVTLYSSSEKGLIVSQNQSYQSYPAAGAQKFLSGGAGLCGTIDDYAKFCQMLLNKGTFNNHKILSRKTVELMTMNQIGDLTFNREGNKFGLGFEVYTEKGASDHLISKGAFRWGGMYFTNYVIDPKENLILLIYSNVHPYRGPNLHHIFHNLVYQALE